MPGYQAPVFPHAAQPEISMSYSYGYRNAEADRFELMRSVRANQKDLYYLTQLQYQIEQLARNVFGMLL